MCPQILPSLNTFLGTLCSSTAAQSIRFAEEKDLASVLTRPPLALHFLTWFTQRANSLPAVEFLP